MMLDIEWLKTVFFKTEPRILKKVKYGVEGTLVVPSKMNGVVGQKVIKIIDNNSGIIYNTMVEAANALNIDTGTVSRYCRGIKGRNKFNLSYYYE